MKVCILSDSHDNRPLMVSAVDEAKQWGAEAVLHCGDIVSPSTLKVLQPFGLPVHLIHGNNPGDLAMLARMAAARGSVLRYHGDEARLELAGRRIFVVHYPHYARGLAATGDWDVVCCGHSHRAGVERLPNLKNGETIFVNPGTVGGVEAPPTFVLADLAELSFEIREVSAS